VHDEVLLQTGRLDLSALDRERNARITGDVLKLSPLPEVARDDLVPIQSNPDAGHLRRAVRVERDEMGERIRLDQPARALRQLHAPRLAIDQEPVQRA
jgi:hypothetical protein